MKTLLNRAAREGTPLVDGDQVTFIWKGSKAPLLIGDFTDWHTSPIELRAAGKGVWKYQMKVPTNSYLEYIFVDGETRYEDPFNTHRINNGVSKINNYLRMPEAQTSHWAQLSKGGLQGQVSEHEVRADMLAEESQRKVWLYQPPSSEPAPLLVVYDGRDYLRRARLAVQVDRMITAGIIPPVALAMVDNAGKRRFVEYACSEATLGFLMMEVIPLAVKEMNLVDYTQHPGAYAIMGASLGGLMALYAGLRLPSVFGRVLSQSGCFSVGDYEFVVWDLIRHSDIKPKRFWMEVGRYEGLLQCNRDLLNLLREKDWHMAYREYNGGHNYTSWCDSLSQGLTWLFGKD